MKRWLLCSRLRGVRPSDLENKAVENVSCFAPVQDRRVKPWNRGNVRRSKEKHMIPFRTILVAADLSDSSREAFRAACSLAREDKTRVFVLNVMEPKFVPETPIYTTDQTV